MTLSGYGKYGLKLLALTMIIPIAHAQDLGVYGQTYPIIEPDLYAVIQTRIHQLQSTGRWQVLLDQWKAIVKAHADRPAAVSGLAPTPVLREWWWDPTVVLKRNIRNADGQIIAQKGTRFNPLEKIHWQKTFFFLDGDDPKQVRWLKKQLDETKNPLKIILVKGSISLLAKQFNRPIYFDQAGRITQRFGIRHVPARLLPGKLKLHIREEIPED